MTFTYNPENAPLDGSINKAEFQRLIKRIRKEASDRIIKYYGCGEYGDENQRPHYHAILFGIGIGKKDHELLLRCWKLGFISVGTVTYDSCRYVAQYIDKKYNGEKCKEVYGDREPPFQLCSQGLGKRYALENAEMLRENLGCTIRGKKVGLPRYYKKLLEIPTEALYEKSLDHCEKVEALYEERGTVWRGDGFPEYAHSRAKRQFERNLEGRHALKKRKL